jgi:hypothetical protein
MLSVKKWQCFVFLDFSAFYFMIKSHCAILPFKQKTWGHLYGALRIEAKRRWSPAKMTSAFRLVWTNWQLP